MNEITPLMAQYREIKKKYLDCVLLFRVGDFYETFYEDAVEVSSILNIALTTRDRKKENPVPLAGVPFHAAENYIARLLLSGKKVAICEQTEDPAKAKGLVKREVVEVLTPGTAMNVQLLDERENNLCLSVHTEGTRAGVAIVDVSTGDFSCGEEEVENLHYLLQGKRVREVVCSRLLKREKVAALLEKLGSPLVTGIEERAFEPEAVDNALRLQFPKSYKEIASLGRLEKTAAGALIHHCQSLSRGELPQVVTIGRLSSAAFLALDEETIANLELFKPLRGGDEMATLIRTIDHTLTPMGGREVRAWLQKPLASPALIEKRLDAVDEIYRDQALHERLAVSLKGICDIQRAASRIAVRKAAPREFIALKESLENVPRVARVAASCRSSLLRELSGKIGNHGDLVDTIDRAIVPDPPSHLREGGVIKKGFSRELDGLIEKSESAKEWIASLERREKTRTGISSLKVGYNKVFGYYIEVSKLHLQSVPQDYLPKQTLVNAQRYYTSELKEREQLILETEDKRVECEQKIFEELCSIVSSSLEDLQRTASALAEMDVLQSFAALARKHGYRRPVVDDSLVLEIVSGRHPVLELLGKEPFVANDLFLSPERKQFALITGPNMSGKSTFLRQSALIVIMAQMGSFVPASRARIGVVDKIFTRVGASDRLSRGESTFLVEMNETAHILRNMMDRSLVLLDEIGRGTSTYDGLSIAWAVTEFVLQGIKARPKTLFATHFHELTQLGSVYPRLVNLKIKIKEWEGGIIFLRKVVPGTSDKSYGIFAARLAGLPPQVLARAEEILHSLEVRRQLLRQGVDLGAGNRSQYDLFSSTLKKEPVAENTSSNTSKEIETLLAHLEVDKTTPWEALHLLKMLKDKLKKEL